MAFAITKSLVESQTKKNYLCVCVCVCVLIIQIVGIIEIAMKFVFFLFPKQKYQYHHGQLSQRETNGFTGQVEYNLTGPLA